MSDVATALKTQFTEWGSNATQADDAALVLGTKCAMIGGKLSLVESGEPLTLDWVKQNKPHLLSGSLLADRTLADRAFIDGHLGSRGELVRQIGKEAADKIAQQYGLKSVSDTRRGAPLVIDGGGDVTNPKKPTAKTNPWAKDNWNASKQTALVKSIGLKAASEIAAAAGSFIGATSPKSKRLISRAG